MKIKYFLCFNLNLELCNSAVVDENDPAKGMRASRSVNFLQLSVGNEKGETIDTPVLSHLLPSNFKGTREKTAHEQEMRKDYCVLEYFSCYGLLSRPYMTPTSCYC